VPVFAAAATLLLLLLLLLLQFHLLPLFLLLLELLTFLFLLLLLAQLQQQRILLLLLLILLTQQLCHVSICHIIINSSKLICSPKPIIRPSSSTFRTSSRTFSTLCCCTLFMICVFCSFIVTFITPSRVSRLFSCFLLCFLLLPQL
jgi:hypothetical protein